MAKTWATFGADLHLELRSGHGRSGHGRSAIERALRDAVQDGRLHPGTRLPSSRALAADLGVARNTIVDAYGQLVAEGWLTAVTGSGTRIADRIADRVVDAVPAPTVRTETPLVRYDLRAGHPDTSSFPRAAWLAAAKRAINQAPRDAFGYGDPRGRPELRQALAGYLSRARGVRADAERIVVCNGFTSALSLLCEVLVDRGGARIAIEAYGHQSYRRLAAKRGLLVHEASVDQLGAVVDDFGDAAAALLTPAHQFPLGMALAPGRRSDAIRWARSGGGLVIEDDYDGEFRYDRQAVGAMQALAPQCVAYAGTASKTLAPGVRLGWLVLPAHLVDDVVAAKAMADRQTGSLDQLTLADLITSGAYDRHVRRGRLAYRRRRDRLTALIREVNDGRGPAPPIRVTGVAAGMHAVLDLPPDWSEAEIVERARARGLALDGLSSYGPSTAETSAAEPGSHSLGADAPPHAPALVIGYGTPPPHAFTTALARLRATLSWSATPS